MLSQVPAPRFESAPQMFDSAECGGDASARHSHEMPSYFEVLSRLSTRRAPPRSALRRPFRSDSSR